MKCQLLGPGHLQNEEMARFWDKIALTPDETHATKALKLVLDDQVERVTMVGGTERPYGEAGRRVIVKLAGSEHPVPLKSLGDGASRLFGIALALANCQDGFLLIDEVENGIHYSVQPDLWRMLLGAARQNNVQVLATTHSWDCIGGFAQAAVADTDAEGVLVRLEKKDGKIKAVQYSQNELKVAAEQGIEVR